MRKRVEGNTVYLENDAGEVVLTAQIDGDTITMVNGDWLLIKDRAADLDETLAKIRPAGVESARFRFYGVTYELRTDLPQILQDFTGMYSRFQADFLGDADMTMHALRTPAEFRYPYVLLMSPKPGLRLKGDFSAVSYLSREEDLLLQVHNETEVYLLTNNPNYAFIHGAALEKDGIGYIMPAESGLGKTTLTLALLKDGFHFMTDEFAVLDSSNRLLLPYPRNLSVRENSLRLFPDLFGRRDSFPKIGSNAEGLYSIDPIENIPCTQGSPCPVRYIIFPRYDPVNGPALRKIPKSEAFTGLVVTRNYLSLGLLDKQPAMDLMLSVIGQSQCFEILSADLERTVGLLHDLH